MATALNPASHIPSHPLPWFLFYCAPPPNQGHAGMTLDDFVKRINKIVVAGGGDPLTRDEVIACRLYTGE